MLLTATIYPKSAKIRLIFFMILMFKSSERYNSAYRIGHKQCTVELFDKIHC